MTDVDSKLLSLLVCPVSKLPLHYDAEAQELVNPALGIAYPIRDGVPIMLEEQARCFEVVGDPVEGDKIAPEAP